MLPAGTFSLTTTEAPMTELPPIVTPGNSIAPAPMKHSSWMLRHQELLYAAQYDNDLQS